MINDYENMIKEIEELKQENERIKKEYEQNKVVALTHYDVEKMSPQQMQYVQNQLLIKQANVFQQELENIQDEIKSTKTELEILKLEQQKTTQIAIKSNRVNQPKEEFVNQTDFGIQGFTPSLSSRSIGKLLKIVGLAQTSRGQTVPYRHFVPKYAIHFAHENYSSVRWHYKKTIDRIDNWLEENEYLEKFYSIQDEKELKEFVDELYESIF